MRSLIGLKFLDLTWPGVCYDDDSECEPPTVTVVSTYVLDANLPAMVKFRREDGTFGSMDVNSFNDYYTEVSY